MWDTFDWSMLTKHKIAFPLNSNMPMKYTIQFISYKVIPATNEIMSAEVLESYTYCIDYQQYAYGSYPSITSYLFQCMSYHQEIV